MAEFYFDYKIKQIGKSKIKTPKLYFEREYDQATMTYSLYAVPEEWVGKAEIMSLINEKKGAEIAAQIDKTLDYDRVEVVFDISGVDCVPLTDKTSDIYNRAEIKSVIKFEEFFKAGCHLEIGKREGVSDHSGAGLLIMMKGDKEVARFFFAVNFTFRKRIDYELSRNGDKLKIKFTCADRPVGLCARVVYNEERLPCLKDDVGVDIIDTFPLDFEKGKIFEKIIELPGDVYNRNGFFNVVFDDMSSGDTSVNGEDAEKFYLLNCTHNGTGTPRPERKKLKPGELVNNGCPFCHSKIEHVPEEKEYKYSSVPCRGSGSGVPCIYSKNGSILTKTLFCANDLDKPEGDRNFKPRFLRVAPDDYLNHDRFKIVFVGSTRAGKSTYISRLFDITGEKSKGINITMAMVKNIFKRMKIELSPAAIPLLEANTEVGGKKVVSYTVTDRNWTDKDSNYTGYSINLNPPSFPEATKESDYSMYPFMTKVNDSYVSFYDIAGEDAEHSKQIGNISNGEPVGVFFLLNGRSSKQKMESVRSMIENAGLSPDCPIAVILTKFDIMENDFDPNCHCTRTDYLDSDRVGNHAYLEREIDVSSREIESYLIKRGLYPSLNTMREENGVSTPSGFKNVKFFGVSSFNYKDSIHDENDSDDLVGKVRFFSSAKRIELPFLWMLKQFGIA